MKSISFFGRKGWKVTAIILATLGAFWIGRMTMTSSPLGFEVGRPDEMDLPSAESFFRYSKPIPLKRLANEWEPQRALVLSMSFTESRHNPDVARYQIDLLAAATPYIDVYVLGEDNYQQAFAYFLALLNRHPDAEAILARTHFVDSRELMRWTRDFGPIFGVGRQNQLVAIDFVYRDLIAELEGATHDLSDTNRHSLAMQGDAMPSDLVSYLQQQTERPVEIVRPPLAMDGGDFASDGRGNVFVSTRTLVRNGGNHRELEELFKRYFKAKKLHVLEALPGRTVHHLDMIFKVVNDDTVLLPDYQTALEPPLNRYRVELVKKTRRALDYNERYIRKNFPGYRVLKVPMPPIMFKTPEEILVEAKTEFVRIAAVEQKLIAEASFTTLTAAERAQIEAKVIEMVKAETGLSDLDSLEGFDAVLQQYGQMSMRHYFDIHAESVTRYRSYINSVFLHNESGQHTFIVPRFTSLDRAETARLQAWEATTERAYRTAWPQADIQWVNCDSLVADMGFIHCTTLTVPAAPLQ